MKRSKYSFTTYTANQDTDEDIEVGVVYNIFGKYYPATLEQPEEWPELEYTVHCLLTEEEISHKISVLNLERIEERCWQDNDERKYDGW